ncbi:inositol 2-dehydrogenase [candidate division KSB1 bacterium]|nr:inositol 2-dehydrogenase [candidate division KSB1 bacterium]
MRQRKLKVGLFGAGRLGKVYARELVRSIAAVELVAVADVDAARAQEIADELRLPRWYAKPLALLEEKDLAAVIIVTPTNTHHDLVIAAAQHGKAVFCEKPLALSLADAHAMQKAIAANGVFFQMGFMRRFDKGYAAAKQKLEAGEIGTPILFRATSRDPFRPSLEYADPKNSGGLIIDMGIHDFDLARWLVGEIHTVAALGNALAYPELQNIGDIDTAILALQFTEGQIGTIDLTRNGVYGYDIATEIVGTHGTLRVGYLRETPLLVMKQNHIAHDVVPYFMERFAQAYPAQLQNFVDNVLAEREPPITMQDGLAALQLAVAATEALKSGTAVAVSSF